MQECVFPVHGTKLFNSVFRCVITNFQCTKLQLAMIRIKEAFGEC